MRFRHRDGTTVHLAYCTTAHPAADLDGLIAGLEGCSVLVRKELDVPLLGVGLWLPPRLADRLANYPPDLVRLRQVLNRENLEVVALNGFSYGGWHGSRVGKNLYRPDWTEPERLRYTRDLIDVLAVLLPTDASYGSVSTLPLAWRMPWTKARNLEARTAFDRLEQYLARTEERTGRRIRVAVEPEPGCVLEMISQAAAWVGRYASPYAGRSPIGLGLDTCHLAVQFEDPSAVFEDLWRSGVDVVMAQLSAALQLADPSDPIGRRVLRDVADPRFLHQIREWGGPGVDDLDQAYELSGHAPWRVHVHASVHQAPRPPLASTTAVVEDCLTRLVGGARPQTHHLELETYTWPTRHGTQQDLAEAIAGDLNWVRDHLTTLGLHED